MDTKSGLPSFSEAEVRKVLGSQEGQQLLRLLNKDGGTALRQAAAAAKSGDMERVREIMRPLAESPDAAALIEKINRK